MIMSPCRCCEKKDQPKDACSGNCEILRDIQLFEATLSHMDRPAGVGVFEELRLSASTRNCDVKFG
jgi:hypothetical protein